MTSVETSALPDSFTIQLPPDWVEIDPNPTGRIERIEAYLDQLAEDDEPPLEDEARRMLRAMLRSGLAQAWETGVVMTSSYFDVDYPEDDPDGEPVFLMAMCNLALLGTGDQGIPSNIVEEAFATSEQARPDRVVSTVELPGGTAVKLRETREIQPEGWQVPGTFIVSQYYIPAGDAAGLAVINFMTPTLALAETFDMLFDVIAETFHWVWE